MSYEEFIKNIEENNYSIINFKEKYIQKFFVNYAINKNNEIDNANIITNFKNLAKCEFILSRSDISKIRSKIIDHYKNLDATTLIQKLSEINKDIINKIEDITYDIVIKNKKIKRTRRLIFFGLEKILNI